MKYFTFIPGILLSLTSVNALAVQHTCKTLEGHIIQLSLDPECQILNEQPDHFPDLAFVGFLPETPETPQGCFSGDLTGTLGDDDTPVTGVFYSGVTENGIGLYTAATSFRLNTNSHGNNEDELGQIFTKDVISFVPDPEAGTVVVLGEVLAMVEGTKKFKDGQGNFEIHGDALRPEYPAAGVPFTGKLCY